MKNSPYIVLAVIVIFCVGLFYFTQINEKKASKQTDENKTSKVFVLLYYYNEDKDRQIAEYMPCSTDAVLPVRREINQSENIIEDTINLLINGTLSQSEKENGFTTEFPYPEFQLLSSELKNGDLRLKFTSVPSFTSGGSCRTGLLRAQIEKTALQFPEVKRVIFDEDIFQP